MRKKLIIFAVVVAIFFIGLIAFQAIAAQLKASAAKKVSDTFVTAVAAGDSNASYDLFTTAAKKDTSATVWQGTATRLGTIFANHHPEYASVETHPTYKLFTYKVTGSDGTYTFSVVIVQQKKDWAVQSFNSAPQS